MIRDFGQMLWLLLTAIVLFLGLLSIGLAITIT